MFLLFFNSSLDVFVNFVIIKNYDSVKEALAQMKGVGWDFPFPTHGNRILRIDE